MQKIKDDKSRHDNLEVSQELLKKVYDEFAFDLKDILATSELLKSRAKATIKFQEPILTINDQPMIFPRTITTIQGPTGVHKSRLSESITSVLLSRTPKNYFGIERRNLDRGEVIILIDTERNLQDQLPFAIQQMKARAGYAITSDPPMFEYISIMEVPRKDRFRAVEAFLELMQKKHTKPLFVILDVITDCVEDFNRVDHTMLIVDSMNRFINKYDTTFLCVIHENPGSDKARGHLGTEIGNKASTTIKIGFEKTSNREVTEILKVQFLKIRSAKRPEPIYLRYFEEQELLVAAAESDISDTNKNRKKAAVEEVANLLQSIFTEEILEISKASLYHILQKDLNASARTIDDRIKEMILEETQVLNFEGQPCVLCKFPQGSFTFFKLQMIKS